MRSPNPDTDRPSLGATGASAWRYCRIDDDGHLYSAWGLQDRYSDRYVIADCPGRHVDLSSWNIGTGRRPTAHRTMPGDDCFCGIYFLQESSSFVRWVDEYDFGSDSHLAMTFIQPLGRVLDADEVNAGARTLRAEGIRIDAILVTPNVDAQTVKRMETRYRVPVVVGAFNQASFDSTERQATQ